MTGIDFVSADAMPAGFWRWPHISASHEWACKSDGTIRVVPEFMDKIETLRMRVGFALPITSGYRSPAHNREVSTTGDDGPHTTGMACDIAVSGVQALTLISTALQVGFLGVGVAQKGPQASRFIHLDMARESPAIWSY